MVKVLGCLLDLGFLGVTVFISRILMGFKIQF